MYRIELTPKAEEELRVLGRSGDKASSVKDEIITVTVVQVGQHYKDK